jgi:uroporphyrinogen decarboxylase
MIDPELYRKLGMPRAKKIYDVVKSKSDIKVFLHTCGAVYDFLPYIIEAGVDIINPVQTSATGMDPQKLKNEFGKDLTFWGGGLDTQKSMLFNTPEQIKDEVKRNSEILMKDGGFIFNQVHNMLPGIPPRNIDAMYEAADEIVY